MNHSEELIREKTKKILHDLDRDYYQDIPFTIRYEENIKPVFSKQTISHGWWVYVFVHDDQWNKEDDPDRIVILFNDETGDTVEYLDGPGRPVPMNVKKDVNGNYHLIQL